MLESIPDKPLYIIGNHRCPHCSKPIELRWEVPMVDIIKSTLHEPSYQFTGGIVKIPEGMSVSDYVTLHRRLYDDQYKSVTVILHDGSYVGGEEVFGFMPRELGNTSMVNLLKELHSTRKPETDGGRNEVRLSLPTGEYLIKKVITANASWTYQTGWVRHEETL